MNKMSVEEQISWIQERITKLRLEKGVSARDMSLSLGQSEGYINKIDNKHNLPSMTIFLYICEYFNLTPQEFFDTNSNSPQKSERLLREIERLTPEQSDHILQIVRDLNQNNK